MTSILTSSHESLSSSTKTQGVSPATGGLTARKTSIATSELCKRVGKAVNLPAEKIKFALDCLAIEVKELITHGQSFYLFDELMVNVSGRAGSSKELPSNVLTMSNLALRVSGRSHLNFIQIRSILENIADFCRGLLLSGEDLSLQNIATFRNEDGKIKIYPSVTINKLKKSSQVRVSFVQLFESGTLSA